MSARLRTAQLAALASLFVLASACSGGSAKPRATATSAPSDSAADATWAMLGHDLASSFHNGTADAFTTSNAATLTQAWQAQVAGSVNGTPAVVDGRVYALATGGLYIFDAATGALVGQNLSIKGTSSPTYDGGKLYINDGQSILHRIDAASGNEDWHAVIDNHPQARGFSSPVVVGDRVIVGSASIEEVTAKDNATFRGSMVAFDANTGAEVWRHYTVDGAFNGVAIWSSPSVDSDAGLVYGTTGNNYTGDASPTSDSIFAIDVTTGAVRWNRQLSTGDVFTIPAPKSDDSDFGTNAILFDTIIDGRPRRLLGAGQKSGMFWALDRDTGDIVWKRKVSGGSALIGGVFNNGAYDGQRIIVAGNNGTSTGAGSEPSNGRSKGGSVTTSVLMAMNPADGSIIWERQLPAWVWAPITLAGSVGFVAADNEIEAFDIATGAKLFAFTAGGTISGGAAVAGKQIFFGSGLSYIGTQPDDKLHALALP